MRGSLFAGVTSFLMPMKSPCEGWCSCNRAGEDQKEEEEEARGRVTRAECMFGLLVRRRVEQSRT